MDSITLIGAISIIATAFTITVGTIFPALGEAKAIMSTMSSIAQQPDVSSTLTRTLFVGLAMIESMAIYCFVIAMILIFANPFWNFVTTNAIGG